MEWLRDAGLACTLASKGKCEYALCINCHLSDRKLNNLPTGAESNEGSNENEEEMLNSDRRSGSDEETAEALPAFVGQSQISVKEEEANDGVKHGTIFCCNSPTCDIL